MAAISRPARRRPGRIGRGAGRLYGLAAGMLLAVAWALPMAGAPDAPSTAEHSLERPRPRRLPAPFQPGERALYEIRWGILKAGTITLEVGEESSPAGEELWRLSGRALSSKWIRPFYRADDSFEARVDRRSFLPRSLTISVDESKEAGFRFVDYDHETGVAHYRKQTIRYKERGPSEEKREDPLAEQAQDVFSALYLLRRVDLVPGEVFYIPVYDNGKNWDTRVEVLEVERYESGLGKLPAFKLSLSAELEGKLRADKDYTLWISKDERRLLLGWEAGLRFGSLKGMLARYRRHAGAPEVGRGDSEQRGWGETGVEAARARGSEP